MSKSKDSLFFSDARTATQIYMGDFYASQDILLNSLSTAERNLSTPDQFSRNMNHAVSLSSLGQEEDYDLFIGDIIELICRATAITELDDSKLAPSLDISKALPKCVICLDNVSESSAIKVPCSSKICFYDLECFKRLVVSTTKDESLFPPHCCDGVKIPFNFIQLHLSPSELQLYREKVDEYLISPQQRLYCSNLICARFLGSKNKNKAMKICIKCGQSTCTTCSSPAHETFTACSTDEDNLVSQALQERYGYQKCSSCGAVSDRNSGCPHMICRCGFAYCFACGRKWGTCRCS